MKIVFRTDASLQIGTGHVMRCLTLADALRANGAECIFICRKHKGNLLEQIRQHGYFVKELPADANEIISCNHPVTDNSEYSSWLGSNWSTDAAQTKLAIGEPIIDWLIVDHYAIDARWERELRSICRNLMVIDDLADRQHECNLLLDQNLGRTKFDYRNLVPDNCIVLTGPSYALLRPEFAEFRKSSLRRRPASKIENLLIMMGGIDQGDATGKILESLKNCTLPKKCEITVMMGANAPWLRRVNSLSLQMPYTTRVTVNAWNIAELMANSDLAIGAAGSASWERCCLGLPTLIVILAKNQIKVANALEQSGCAKVIGPPDSISKNLPGLIQTSILDNKMYGMTELCRGIIDGHGVDRVKRALLENHV